MTVVTADDPRSPVTSDGQSAKGLTQQITANSRVIACWILVSRLTGFCRVAALAAILGPTFFGNLFQTVILIPYAVCELIGGSMIVGMLVPSLVRAQENGGEAGTSRLAGGFFGAILPILCGLVLVVGLAAPDLLRLVTMTVDDPGVRELQISIGSPLLLMLLLQIPLYGLIGTAIAVQNSRHRFAFAAGAPTIENIFAVLVLAAYAYFFGVGEDVHQIGPAELTLLGLGMSAATAMHAALQWCGARRAGITIIPWAGWRSVEVRAALRNVLPSGGASGLANLGFLILTAAAGRVPGGAIAVQIAINIFNLPVALAATPLALAQQPLLARLSSHGQRAAFTAAYVGSQKLALFIILPAAALLVAIPAPIAAAISFGEMNEGSGLVAAAIAGIGLGVIAESAFSIARSAAYARFDALANLYASALRVGFIAAGIAIASMTDDPSSFIYRLTLSYAVASIIAAVFLHVRVFGQSSSISSALLIWFARNAAIAAAAVIPSALLAFYHYGDAALADQLVKVACLSALAGLLYLTLQFIVGSSELRSLFVSSRTTKFLHFPIVDDAADKGRL